MASDKIDYANLLRLAVSDQNVVITQVFRMYEPYLCSLAEKHGITEFASGNIDSTNRALFQKIIQDTWDHENRHYVLDERILAMTLLRSTFICHEWLIKFFLMDLFERSKPYIIKHTEPIIYAKAKHDLISDSRAIESLRNYAEGKFPCIPPLEKL